MANVEIAHAVVTHLVTRLESLALDSPSVRARLRHDDTGKAFAEGGALDTIYRRFRWVAPSRAVPDPEHVTSGELHPRLWRLALGLEVIYPFGDTRNAVRVGCVAIDDQTRIVHHLEYDHTRVNVAGQYDWSGVLVTTGDIVRNADHLVSSFAVTAIYQRVF